MREWDAVGSAEIPGLAGDEHELVVLEGEAHPFADALHSALEPPYRVRAVRRRGDEWAVAAKQIRVAHLPGVAGAELLLTVQEGSASLEVDGMPTIAGLDRVLAAVDERHASYVVRAARVREDVWEVDVAPL